MQGTLNVQNHNQVPHHILVVNQICLLSARKEPCRFRKLLV